MDQDEPAPDVDELLEALHALEALLRALDRDDDAAAAGLVLPVTYPPTTAGGLAQALRGAFGIIAGERLAVTYNARILGGGLVGFGIVRTADVDMLAGVVTGPTPAIAVQMLQGDDGRWWMAGSPDPVAWSAARHVALPVPPGQVH